jgi:hypothetical protein
MYSFGNRVLHYWPLLSFYRFKEPRRLGLVNEKAKQYAGLRREPGAGNHKGA